MDFSCFHSKESILTTRLYIGLYQNESEIKNTVFSNGKEKKGLGVTEYGNILGRFLSFIGYAFKTKDKEGNILYVNKKSFCNMIDRLYQNKQKYNYFNADFVEANYNSKKDQSTKQRLEKIYGIFNTAFPRLSDENIGDIAIKMLKKYSQSFSGYDRKLFTRDNKKLSDLDKKLKASFSSF